jgi:hypothetical protein
MFHLTPRPLLESTLAMVSTQIDDTRLRYVREPDVVGAASGAIVRPIVGRRRTNKCCYDDQYGLVRPPPAYGCSAQTEERCVDARLLYGTKAQWTLLLSRLTSDEASCTGEQHCRSRHLFSGRQRSTDRSQSGAGLCVCAGFELQPRIAGMHGRADVIVAGPWICSRVETRMATARTQDASTHNNAMAVTQWALPHAETRRLSEQSK